MVCSLVFDGVKEVIKCGTSHFSLKTEKSERESCLPFYETTGNKLLRNTLMLKNNLYFL